MEINISEEVLDEDSNDELLMQNRGFLEKRNTLKRLRKTYDSILR